MKRKVSVITGAAIAAAVVIVSIMMAAGPAEARRGGGHGPGPMLDPEFRLEFLTIVLDLTEDQRAKIGPVLEEEVSEIEAMRKAAREKAESDGGERGNRPRDGRGEKFREVHEYYSGLIIAELDAAQAEKYNKLEELMKSKFQERRGEGRREGRGGRPQ